MKNTECYYCGEYPTEGASHTEVENSHGATVLICAECEAVT